VTYFLYILILVGVAVGVCWLNDRFTHAVRRWRNRPEKLAADRRAYEARIANPDWEFYERHLCRPAPASLRELYSDCALVLTKGIDFDKAHRISTFEPLDEAALIDTHDLFGFNVVPFANGEGDIIYLRPGSNETDAVFITYHDGGDTEQLAPDISSFLQRLRDKYREA
jgi:hypothetical protein